MVIFNWILNDVESFAMWDTYGKNGFVLRFEREYFQNLVEKSIYNQRGLTSELDSIVAGKVEYQNFDKMSLKEDESLLKYCVFRKHLSFYHENEYRIVGSMNIVNNANALRYKLQDIEVMKFDIFANPRFNSFQFEKYKTILGMFSKRHILVESELKFLLEFRGNNY